MQIGQVLTNLIENASRFAPDGTEIHITAARWRSAIQVRITDQGPGIPESDRDRVFEEFYRRDAGEGRGGTGLGLAIARAVVIAHGGTISAGAAPAAARRSTFELPIARNGPHDDASSSAAPRSTVS